MNNILDLIQEQQANAVIPSCKHRKSNANVIGGFIKYAI